MADRRKGLLFSASVGCFLLASFLGGVTCDVPEDVVYTDLHKTVRIGDSVILTCQFRGEPLAVYWKKGDDPKKAPNLVSWIPTDDVTGLCEGERPCEIMEMNENRSLLIKEVSIAEEGRYICRVSSYKGRLIHNFTDIRLFSTPEEPYPIIKQCDNDSTQVCSISTNESITITCSATNFYPDLDLFFLHGSQKMTDIGSTESTNHDGTKDKSISIKASASETPYICVASDIPGSKDQRAATIFVNSAKGGIPAPSSTNAVTMDTTTSNRAAKIGVPIIIIILVIGAVVVCIFLWWKSPRLFRRIVTGDCVTGSNSATTGDTEERIPMDEKAKIARSHSATASDAEERIPMFGTATIAGDLSFYELWSLAYDTPSDERKQIHQVLLNLGIKEVKVGLLAPDIYELLCKWKDGHRKEKYVQLLQSALKRENLERRWIALCEQRQRTDVKVSQATLDQILLDIQSPQKLQKFLRKLIRNTKHDPIVEATELMRRWRNGPFTENPNALLSLALERSGCSQVDRTFFVGMVSFYELWLISRKMTGNEGETRGTLEKLGMDLEDGLTEDDIYFHLCTWKEANTNSNQGKLLRDALERANSKEIWRGMKELREKSDAHVSDKILEHIVWHIQDPEKIGQFLRKLTFNESETCLDVSQGMKDIIKDAMGHLVKWKQQRFDENPIVLMSHALDKMACNPVDRLFFRVPFELMGNIIEFEVEGFVDRLTRRHIEAMSPFLDISNIGKKVNAIHEGNKDLIFNTKAMITEWIEQVECSNYEKRWRLSQAITRIGRQDLTGYFGTNLNPEIHLHVGVEKETRSSAHSKGHTMKMKDLNLSNFVEDEFQRITNYLSSSQMKEIFGIVDEDPRDELRAYVERLMADKSKQNWRDKLRKKLNSAELKVLIPYALASNVYLCELLDVAFRLLLDDVYPLAETLGISAERLKKYRVDYTPDHLTQGTTAALINFCETNDNDRGKVCEALSNAGYKNISVLLCYGHETSLADEFAVASRAGDNKEDLAKVSRNLEVSDMSNIGTVLRDWKAMVHPPFYNHRTALADAVFPVLGVHVAIAILSGQYRENRSQSSEVIQSISSGIESLEPSILKNIIGVNDSKNLQDEKGFTCSLGSQLPGESEEIWTDNRRRYKPAIALKISRILGVPIAEHSQESSIRQVLETWEEKISRTPLSKDKRRELSDDLLMAGFKQFAFEIMTGFVSRPKKLLEMQKKKDKQDQKSKRGEQSKRGKQEIDKDHVNQNKAEQEDVDGSVDTMDRKSRHGKDDQGKAENDAQTNQDTNDRGDDKDNKKRNEQGKEENDGKSNGNEDPCEKGKNDRAVGERSSQEQQVVLND